MHPANSEACRRDDARETRPANHLAARAARAARADANPRARSRGVPRIVKLHAETRRRVREASEDAAARPRNDSDGSSSRAQILTRDDMTYVKPPPAPAQVEIPDRPPIQDQPPTQAQPQPRKLAPPLRVAADPPKLHPYRRCECRRAALGLAEIGKPRCRGGCSRRIPRDGRRTDAQAARTGGAPVLYLQLFGPFAAFADGVAVASRDLHRSKLQAIVAMLLLARGATVPADQVQELLWPDMDDVHGRNNLYSTWSYLVGALRLPGGECPYFQRTNEGLRVVPAFVRSDLEDFELVGAHLAAAGPDDDVTAHAETLKHLVRSGFLPTCFDYHGIASVRSEVAQGSVDALLDAAAHALDRGQHRTAGRLAQTALELDELREDAYELQMRALIGQGKRAEAHRVFLTCREVVKRELGAEPNAAVRRALGQLLAEARGSSSVPRQLSLGFGE